MRLYCRVLSACKIDFVGKSLGYAKTLPKVAFLGLMLPLGFDCWQLVEELTYVPYTSWMKNSRI